jgi:hypothetical protein
MVQYMCVLPNYLCYVSRTVMLSLLKIFDKQGFEPWLKKSFL